MPEPTLNQRWSAAIVGELMGAGVRHVVVCPGSRSTPLALACAEAAGLRLHSVVDERSAGFIALGLGKALGVPAAVVCTSGSAGAHLLPAVIEASMGGTPLVVLTADRPVELQGFGAPQTIDQRQLFGRFAAHFEALPEPSDGLEAHLRAVVSRAVRHCPHAPVHFNVPFREPLAPSGPGPRAVASAPVVMPGRVEVDPDGLERVRAALRGVERGVIVAGPREADDGFGEAVAALGQGLGFAVLAEAASNARFGWPGAISTYDALLRHPPFAAAHQPQVVLRFGGGLTPKSTQQWLEASGARLFVFSDHGHLFDPGHQAELVLVGDAVQAARALTPVSPQPERGGWRAAQAVARRALEPSSDVLTEPRLARELTRALPDGACLVLSSSMPIRDVDAFGCDERGPLRVFSNRGANGIDGVTSTALGVALGSGHRTVLLIGDLALLHDLGGLLAARRLGASLTVVVANNDGGGIFSFLPVASSGEHFEQLFGTPHGIDLQHVSALAGATHHRPTSVAQLQQALLDSTRGVHLIEVRSDRQQNVERHRELFSGVAQALGAGPWA